MALFFLLLAPVAVMAEDDSDAESGLDTALRNVRQQFQRSSYTGIYIMDSRYDLEFSGAGDSNHTHRATGIGMVFGTRMTKTFGLEMEWQGAGVTMNYGGQHSRLDNYSIMINGRYGYEMFGFFKPYIGAGIGPSFWVNDTTMVGGDGGFRDTQWGLSFQAFSGIILSVTDLFALDFGMKMQSLGRAPGGGPQFEFAPAGNVINTEARVGVLWRY